MTSSAFVLENCSVLDSYVEGSEGEREGEGRVRLFVRSGGLVGIRQ